MSDEIYNLRADCNPEFIDSTVITCTLISSIALPADYGNTWIKVGDVIKENKFTKINISDYFVGENWKIHPDWVYCKYHYLEGHEFDSPELELKEFLRKIFEPDWKWSEQYEADPEAETQQSDESQTNEQKQCEFFSFLNCLETFLVV